MSGGATARLFVAVDVQAAVREELVIWARSVAAGLGSRITERAGQPLRLLEPEALHLTLCFLGARPVEEIEAITAALGDCAQQVGELSVGAPVWLPPRRPRALAVEIHDAGGELEGIQETVAREISRATVWEPEHRRFRAHITVARVRESAARRGRSAGERPRLPATPQLRFTPESIVLYRSWLSPAGASYQAIAACALVPAGR
jgi:RNA 2',3'-cyclic 3'-phosphodiesterase